LKAIGTRTTSRSQRLASAQLFSNDLSVYEQSLAGLGGFRFAVIRKRRRAPTEQLTWPRDFQLASLEVPQ